MGEPGSKRRGAAILAGLGVAFVLVGLALSSLYAAGRLPSASSAAGEAPSASMAQSAQDVVGAGDDADTETEDDAEAVAGDAIEPLVAPSITASTELPEDESGLVVRFLDVGQGDCALVACEGHHMLIDGGPREASQKVYTVLANLGIEHLDYIIATHPDADHIGGISAALNVATCGVCYSPVTASDTRTFESMRRYVDEASAPFVVPQIPTTLSLGSATVELIGPLQNHSDSDNNNSIVCRLDYGDASFLFTGDAEREAERDLLDSGADLHADVLKVAHHGSAYSSTDAFIAAVDPKIAVVSVGAENGYGHPAKDALDTLHRYGAEVYRTDESGDIIIVSDGAGVQVATTRKASS